ncbi:Flagellar basal-body rod modification protein FlgD [Euzebya pacifica]|uniref:Flagellar basal-body rod modification protein FlgD n=1 Tax=Euzebya pacifica TaxID=1608957 RepID=A0A346XUH2_9ACTN|nr:flagellar hook capping FlgD N-terminal domain-containing protein [Euzebya pacifica]AXV05869.1 Flagellar basal-body rod modification protein FlgD [Euzebya pacifica]
MPDAISAAMTTPQVVTSDTPTLDPSLLENPDSFDQEMFLQLLVAQLKYQNPLDPMDSSEFMAQSAQFTTVEKLEQLTTKIGESIANDRLGTATGLIGREVSFTRADGSTAAGDVTSVRFEPFGPVLVLSDRTEIGMADISSVSARTA